MPEGSPAAWGPGVGIADRENFPKSRARDGVFPDVRSSLLTPSAHGSFAEPPPQHRAPFPCALFGALRLCLLAWGFGILCWEHLSSLLHPIPSWGSSCPLSRCSMPGCEHLRAQVSPAAPREPGVGSEAGETGSMWIPMAVIHGPCKAVPLGTGNVLPLWKRESTTAVAPVPGCRSRWNCTTATGIHEKS